MSLFTRREARVANLSVIPGFESRANSSRPANVTQESALRHSAVWACLRLRANAVSMLPVDLYRRVGGVQTLVTKPQILVTPDGESMRQWLYSTQFDLDRAGNCFGIITARDGFGFPSRIELLPLQSVVMNVKDGVVTYRVDGKVMPSEQIYHEKQYTVAGLPWGLSPGAYAAWSIGEYLAIQDFALDWFENKGVNAGRHLRNTTQTMVGDVAAKMKQRYRESVRAGDVFVSGRDWEFAPINDVAATNDWLDGKQFGIADIGRFYDVPGDLIDAAVMGSSVTYANIVQRNLQFLIQNMQGTLGRREDALTALTGAPRYVKLNTDALLRMDPLTRAQVLAIQRQSKVITTNEWRELEDRPPLTDAQLAEFDKLDGARNPAPANPNQSPVPVGVKQ